MLNEVKVTRYEDLEWKMSRKINGWFHARLRGEHNATRTFLIKADLSTKYYSWICENISEFFVLEGELVVNDDILHKNDYAIIEPFVEVFNEAKKGMRAICTVHGRVVWARDIFVFFYRRRLSEEEIMVIVNKPWLKYLQSHVGKENNSSKNQLNSILKKKILSAQEKKFVELLLSK